MYAKILLKNGLFAERQNWRMHCLGLQTNKVIFIFFKPSFVSGTSHDFRENK